MYTTSETATVLGRTADDSEPTFGSKECYAMMHQLEAMKATVLNLEHRKKSEAVHNGPHGLSAEEQQLSLHLTHNLAHAILHESEKGAQGSVWGAGM